jgi:predicted esterase
MAEELKLNFNFEARYFKTGDIKTAKEVWFVLHGYGQLAKYFIRKFSALEQHLICVIAPEGLSHFYLENIQTRAAGGSNRVGATWMTRENREADIHNYVSYLNNVYEKEVGNQKIKTTLLGFSQGSATVTRWALDGNVRFDRLILWAGIFPPDMDFQKGRELFLNKEVIDVVGLSDPFITKEKILEFNRLSEALGITPTLINFEGAHDIDSNTLLKIVSSQTY